MEAYIGNKLDHLSVAERKRVFTMLCLIGIEYVDEICSNLDGGELNAALLKHYCGMYFIFII